MEDHPFMFPILAIIGLGYLIYYSVLGLWLIVKIIYSLIKSIFIKENKGEVNNNVNR